MIGFLLMSFTSLAMTSADAVKTVLNSKNATGAKTFAAAKEIVEREAADGKPLQQFVVGVTTDDKELAKRYLDASRDKIRALAEKKDNPLAWYLLSMENNDFKMLRRAADGGNVQALNALGSIARAADGGNVQALNALGSIATQEALVRGNIPTNSLEEILRQSFVYFSKAAAQRDRNGFINLGTCYLSGFGCQRDMGLAFACFKAAAEAGHPEGMDNVSACYQFGHGVKKDSELCLLWAMRGRAARGDEAAAKWLKDRK